MRLHRSKIERGATRAKELLSVHQETLKPFNFEQEYEGLESGLDALLDRWITWPNPPQEFWTSLGYIQIFLSERKDIQRYLDFSKVYPVFVQKAKESAPGTHMVFQLMQLFPNKREELFNLMGGKADEIPHKVPSGELFLINELLVMASAHPERLQEYQARASQELSSVKEWINESLTFPNQLRVTLQLAANFLKLCPQYKTEMQDLFTSHVRRAVDELKFREYSERLQILGDLEIIYATDEFVLNSTGNLVKQPKQSQLDSSVSLPERLTA